MDHCTYECTGGRLIENLHHHLRQDVRKALGLAQVLKHAYPPRDANDQAIWAELLASLEHLALFEPTLAAWLKEVYTGESSNEE